MKQDSNLLEEEAFIPVDFMCRKHDYFVAKCLQPYHAHKTHIHISKDNPNVYATGLYKATKAQYNEWFGEDYDEEERKWHVWKEYGENMPFLFEHREEIYARPDYYYAQTPLSVMFIGRVYLGALLRAYELESKLFVYPCDKEGCDGVSYIYYFAGSPLSGSMSANGTCNKCGEMSCFRASSFMKMMHALDDIMKADLPDGYVKRTEKPLQPLQLQKQHGNLVLDFTPKEGEMSPERLTVSDVIHLLRSEEAEG
jgi:hypothetical protein